MRRGALAAALRRGEWTEGLHPDSPLVFEAMATVENEFEAVEYRLSEIRRQEALFAGELHQLMRVSARLQRGQMLARRAMVRATSAPVSEQPEQQPEQQPQQQPEQQSEQQPQQQPEQQSEQQSEQQQSEQEPGVQPRTTVPSKAAPRTRSRSARRAARTMGRTESMETEPLETEFSSCFENAIASENTV